MKQKNKFIKERLKHKQKQLSMQAIRQERLNRTMQNTKDDIDQLIYALHELEEAEKGNHKRHTIPYNEVFSFFTRICRLFDYLQHRCHKYFNYRLTCLVIHAHYRFRSRTRAPGREYLSPGTILTYFKHEWEMIV